MQELATWWWSSIIHCDVRLFQRQHIVMYVITKGAPAEWLPWYKRLHFKWR